MTVVFHQDRTSFSLQTNDVDFYSCPTCTIPENISEYKLLILEENGNKTKCTRCASCEHTYINYIRRGKEE